MSPFFSLSSKNKLTRSIAFFFLSVEQLFFCWREMRSLLNFAHLCFFLFLFRLATLLHPLKETVSGFFFLRKAHEHSHPHTHHTSHQNFRHLKSLAKRFCLKKERGSRVFSCCLARAGTSTQKERLLKSERAVFRHTFIVFFFLQVPPVRDPPVSTCKKQGLYTRALTISPVPSSFLTDASITSYVCSAKRKRIVLWLSSQLYETARVLKIDQEKRQQRSSVIPFVHTDKSQTKLPAGRFLNPTFV